ncbi:hypothetical protein [Deinococcus sp.]|uniref:hypothetical protein n=1 Tax=Deinococcus sp. TaxID=47478 RepID=UPI003CC621D2
MNAAVAELRQQRGEFPNTTVEQAIQHPQATGHGKVASIGAIANEFGLTIEQTKIRVRLSPSWEFCREADERLHENLERDIEQLRVDEIQGIRAQLSTYAAIVAGTRDDLDPDLEEAGLEVLRNVE